MADNILSDKLKDYGTSAASKYDDNFYDEYKKYQDEMKKQKDLQKQLEEAQRKLKQQETQKIQLERQKEKAKEAAKKAQELENKKEAAFIHKNGASIEKNYIPPYNFNYKENDTKIESISTFSGGIIGTDSKGLSLTNEKKLSQMHEIVYGSKLTPRSEMNTDDFIWYCKTLPNTKNYDKIKSDPNFQKALEETFNSLENNKGFFNKSKQKEAQNALADLMRDVKDPAARYSLEQEANANKEKWDKLVEDANKIPDDVSNEINDNIKEQYSKADFGKEPPVNTAPKLQPKDDGLDCLIFPFYLKSNNYKYLTVKIKIYKWSQNKWFNKIAGLTEGLRSQVIVQPPTPNQNTKPQNDKAVEMTEPPKEEQTQKNSQNDKKDNKKDEQKEKKIKEKEEEIKKLNEEISKEKSKNRKQYRFFRESSNNLETSDILPLSNGKQIKTKKITEDELENLYEQYWGNSGFIANENAAALVNNLKNELIISYALIDAPNEKLEELEAKQQEAQDELNSLRNNVAEDKSEKIETNIEKPKSQVNDMHDFESMIVFPLPENLTDGYSQEWEQTNHIINSFVKNSLDSALTSLNDLASYSRPTNKPAINPGAYKRWSGTSLRSFDFKWNFVVTSRDEGVALMNIIYELKKAASPKRIGALSVSSGEIANAVEGFTENLFMKDPNHFIIEFGNTILQKSINIKRCALTKIDVDYTTDSTGTVETTGDGMPKQIKLTLGFSEIEQVFDTDFQKIDDVTSNEIFGNYMGNYEFNDALVDDSEGYDSGKYKFYKDTNKIISYDEDDLNKHNENVKNQNMKNENYYKETIKDAYNKIVNNNNPAKE